LIKLQDLANKALLRADIVPKDNKIQILTDMVMRDYPKYNATQVNEAVNLLLPQYLDKVGNTTDSNRPTRNNNPLNIKSSGYTSQFDGVSGTDPSPASDGGKFLTFESPQAGFEAGKKLITSSGYKNLSVDNALKRWSNKGYGAEIVPTLANKTINQLSDNELNTLIQAMARREGYNA
jgi:hypothetical protein